jgi:hypothetical protein
MRSRRIKSRKYKLKRKQKTKRRIRRGGNELEQVDIRQILLTKPIINSILEQNPNIDIKQFKLSKGEQGFKLTRMDRMMESNFDKLIEQEPIELKVARTSDGKLIGTKIDENMKIMYEIINGRHRISRAIVDGYTNIDSKIIK